MADQNRQLREKLRKLGRRAQQGWAKLHPVTEKQLAKVREAVIQQWDQTHAAQAKTETLDQSAARSTQRRKRQAQGAKQHRAHQDRSQSHDEGHSY